MVFSGWQQILLSWIPSISEWLTCHEALTFHIFCGFREGLIFVASQTSNFSQTFFLSLREHRRWRDWINQSHRPIHVVVGDFRAICEVASRGDGRLFTRIVREKGAIKKMFVEVSCVDNWRQCNEKGKKVFSEIVLPVPKNHSQQALRHDWNGLLRDKNRLKRWVKVLDNKTMRLSGQWIHFIIVNNYVNERLVWAAFLALLS